LDSQAQRSVAIDERDVLWRVALGRVTYVTVVLVVAVTAAVACAVPALRAMGLIR
jgi:hypothetical protein